MTGQLVASMKSGGKVYVYGAMGGLELTVPLMPLLFNVVTVQVRKRIFLSVCVAGTLFGLSVNLF